MTKKDPVYNTGSFIYLPGQARMTKKMKILDEAPPSFNLIQSRSSVSLNTDITLAGKQNDNTRNMLSVQHDGKTTPPTPPLSKGRMGGVCEIEEVFTARVCHLQHR